MSNGADPNKKDGNGKISLHYAIHKISSYSFDPNAVAFLICNGANPNTQDAEGKTQLHYLCKNFHDDHRCIIELLLMNGARLDVQDAEGNTPLHYLCQQSVLLQLQ